MYICKYVCACVCMYVYVCVYVCMYVYVYIHIYSNVYIHIRTYTCTYICIRIHIHRPLMEVIPFRITLRDTPHSHVWHDSCIHVPWLIRMCDINQITPHSSCTSWHSWAPESPTYLILLLSVLLAPLHSCLPYTRTRMHTYIHTYAQICCHTCISPICMKLPILLPLSPTLLAQQHACPLHIHTCILTYIHTYIHTWKISHWYSAMNESFDTSFSLCHSLSWCCSMRAPVPPQPINKMRNDFSFWKHACPVAKMCTIYIHLYADLAYRCRCRYIFLAVYLSIPTRHYI